ncbi:MAG: hypothetical protein O9340_02595 [Cyclobacteriaceae bacterium]|nr:hypothetical protein [Cyclobacteriaceae bacterium]
MRKLFFIVFLFNTLVGLAQERRDSLFLIANSKKDSLQINFQNKKDSIQSVFKKTADSVNVLYQKPIIVLNKEEASLKQKLDSLLVLGQKPNEKIQEQLDSIRLKKEKLIGHFNEKRDSVVQRYQQKVAKLNKVQGAQNKVIFSNTNINATLPSSDLPETNFQLPKFSGLGLNQTEEISSVTERLPIVSNPIANTKIENPINKIETPKELNVAKDVKSKIETFKNDTTSIDQKASKVAEDKIAKETGLEGLSFEANRSNYNIYESALQMPITYVLVTNEDEYGFHRYGRNSCIWHRMVNFMGSWNCMEAK